MLKALKTIFVGIGFVVFGVVSLYLSYDNKQGEPALIGAGAIILGLLGIFGGVRMMWVPAAVGGGRREGRSSTQNLSSLLGNQRRRVIKPHDCAVELPFDL